MGVKKIIKDSYFITHKDLLEFARNRVGLLFMFIFPFFMLFMTGFIFPSGSIQTDMPVAIVDMDNGADAARFIDQLVMLNEKDHYMDFKQGMSLEEAKTSITRGELYGAIVIPEDFSKDLSSGKQANMTVFVDKSNPQVAAQIQGVASGAISGLGSIQAASAVGMLSAKANMTVNPLAVIHPYNVEVKGTIPGETNYFSFVAPGLLIMIVMLGAMTGIPRAISHEKEIGTFDGILAAPINQISIIIGKTMAQTIRGILQGFVVMVLAVIFFGVTIHGSIPLALMILILGVFSFIGLGIVMTALAADEETAMLLMSLLQFPMMFLSGVFFPIQQMPWFMQWISQIIPITYAADAMRKVMILDAGVSDIFPEIAILVGFGIVTLGIAIPLFRRSMTR
ncbi:ABC transporter permease [Methanocella sp. CWC-04]|uniref:ABC transporter permease n=1 Tax=Methanooceanicella nereidis TaxID=2052831 RepID=A0AAP2RD30_9EURY|nr:ABC transporter permease [Methanocella sp. CWC-04]MCD1295103.1 ABC transporter permease [Methanocella sp. CWC-04]